MSAEILRLDLTARRRALVGWAAGMALYAFLIVALYPEFKHSTGIDAITRNNPTLAALFGAVGSLTSPSGWLNVNLYANFFPLAVLFVTIGYGASCVAGQDEDRTLGLLASLPISRGRMVVQKIGAMTVQAAVIITVVALAVAAGRPFGIAIGAAHLVGVSVGMLFLGLDFGLFALFVGAATGNRGTALGAATGLAGASYLVGSLAPVVDWVRPARYGSLFYWAVDDNQVSTGMQPAAFAVLALAAVTLACVATRAFNRLDLR